MSVTPKSLRDVATYMRRASGVDPIWLREAADEIERMREQLVKAESWKLEYEASLADIAENVRIRDQLDQAKLALAQIKHATLCGRVCDDVAWFDSITTLHDFCDLTLDALSDDLGTKK